MNHFLKLSKLFGRLASALAAILIFCLGFVAATLWRAQANEKPCDDVLSKAALARVVSAIDCARIRMDVSSQNIANLQTTRDVDGKPYQCRVVVIETKPDNNVNSSDSSRPATKLVARVEKDRSPFLKIYAPGHPDADKKGLVELPNVDITLELANFMMAKRAFEANMTILKMARATVRQPLPAENN